MSARGHFVRYAVAATLLLAGCADPTFIGVQDYGTIIGNAVSSTGSPIAGAYISSTGTTAVVTTAGNGAFSLQRVAIGEQTVTINAIGYNTATVMAIVPKNDTVSVNNVTLTATGSTPITK